MNQTNNIRSLSMAFLAFVATDCKSDDNIFEISTAVSYSTVYNGTSSHKFYSAENEFKALQFAQINWSNVTTDMAKGEGQYLQTLADLLNIPTAQKISFYRMSKSKFSQLIPSSETPPKQLVYNLKNEMAKLELE